MLIRNAFGVGGYPGFFTNWLDMVHFVLFRSYQGQAFGTLIFAPTTPCLSYNLLTVMPHRELGAQHTKDLGITVQASGIDECSKSKIRHRQDNPIARQRLV
jgi:hypothetical protein